MNKLKTVRVSTRTGKESLRARSAALYTAGLLALLAALRSLGPELLKRFLCVLFGLAQPVSGSIRRLGDLRVPGAAPGVQLATTAYAREGPAPTLLVRTPYGKCLMEFIGYALATQGFNVVLQDCRGRWDSTGEQAFGAFEDSDGVALVDWLAQQGFTWYDPNRIVSFGISYLGITQWALVAGLARRKKHGISTEASGTKAKVAAISPLFSASRVYDIFYSQNTFRLDFYIRYVHFMLHVNSRLGAALLLLWLVPFELRHRYYTRRCLSLKTLHRKLGVPLIFKYNPRQESRFWKNRDYSDAISSAPPALIATGWYDIMLESSLQDYEALVQTHGPGHSRLLVGPWHHLESTHLPAFRVLFRSSVDFLQEKCGLLQPLPFQEQYPVRVWVMGPRASQGRWQHFSDWPPKEAQEQLMLLGRGTLGTLGQSDEHPSSSDASLLKYNPHDPPPSLGGSGFNLLVPFVAGEARQASLEAHADVLRFDSQPLLQDICVVGRARLRLSIRASRPHFDVFARLCDVHPSGSSFNVCDAALRRHAPLENSRSHQEVQSLSLVDTSNSSLGRDLAMSTFDIDLVFSSTAKCFKAGHRIRLLLAGGRYPECARNFGDMEQTVLDKPLEVVPYTLEILHLERAPSSLWLPVVSTARNSRRQSRNFGETAAERPKAPAKRHSKIIDASLRRINSDVTALH